MPGRSTGVPSSWYQATAVPPKTLLTARQWQVGSSATPTGTFCCPLLIRCFTCTADEGSWFGQSLAFCGPVSVSTASTAPGPDDGPPALGVAATGMYSSW